MTLRCASGRMDSALPLIVSYKSGGRISALPRLGGWRQSVCMRTLTGLGALTIIAQCILLPSSTSFENTHGMMCLCEIISTC